MEVASFEVVHISIVVCKQSEGEFAIKELVIPIPIIFLPCGYYRVKEVYEAKNVLGEDLNVSTHSFLYPTPPRVFAFTHHLAEGPFR